MARILFVDDDPLMLQGLERLLSCYRREWKMDFVTSGEKALTRLAEQPFHVLVTDLDMRGMTGAELLGQCREQYPDTVRIVLSGLTEAADIVSATDLAHQFFAKPCAPGPFKDAVSRCLALRRRLENETLRALVHGLSTLPSLPGIYLQLVELLSEDESSLNEAAELIASDVGLTTGVLKLVNSSFFGIFQRIESPGQAVALLGLDRIRAVVLSAGIFSQFESASLAFELESFVDHSLAVGNLAHRITRQCGGGSQKAGDALMAGILHDVGQLVVATGLPGQFERSVAMAEEEDMPPWDAEVACLGVSHADVGAHLLELWSFPNQVVEAVAFHQVPGRCPTNDVGPLLGVHVANALAHPSHLVRDPLDRAYAARMRIERMLPQWQEAVPVA